MGISTPAVTLPTYARPQGNYSTYTPPLAPSALVVSVVGSTANLAWVSNSNNETGFTVEQASSLSGPWTTIATKIIGSTSHSVSNLADGTYYFRVRANRFATYSDYAASSAAVVAAIGAPLLAAPVISGSTATIAFTGGTFTTLIPQWSSNGGTTWNSISNDTSSPLTFTGLSAGNYQFRALANGLTGYASNVVSGTVAPNGSYIGAGQLAADEYVPTRLPLQWSNPTGAEGTGSRYLWAHTEFNYQAPFVPMGGSPPYRFMATVDNPDGFSIAAKAPAWNPHCYLWADVTILADAFQSGTRTFTVYCQDQFGETISVSVIATVNNGKFLFLESGVGTGGDGSIDSPFSLVNQWYLSSYANATHAGKICVYNGTFDIDNFDASIAALRVDNNKPRAHIAFPGATVTWNSAANIASSGTTADWFFGGIRIVGADSTSANPRVFAMLGTLSRAAFDRIEFDTPSLGTTNNDNTSCIYASNDGTNSKSNISIVDAIWSDLPGASNGLSMFDFYAAQKVSIVGGTARGVSAGYGAWAKNANTSIFVAGLDAYDPTNTGNRILYAQNGSAPAGAKVHYCYNKAARATDGTLNQEKVMEYGETDYYGGIYFDRNTILGRIGGDDSTAASTGSTATVNRNLVINNRSGSKIESTQTVTDNVTDSRANISNYLDADGDVLPGYGQYGKVGATVKVA